MVLSGRSPFVPTGAACRLQPWRSRTWRGRGWARRRAWGDVARNGRGGTMDPEDVRRLLQPYHARVRAELERFGGTVEKFIGDAVMAVFGAPVAHEDDPERAVRAALAIRDWARQDRRVEVRIA